MIAAWVQSDWDPSISLSNLEITQKRELRQRHNTEAAWLCNYVKTVTWCLASTYAVHTQTDAIKVHFKIQIECEIIQAAAHTLDRM